MSGNINGFCFNSENFNSAYGAVCFIICTLITSIKIFSIFKSTEIDLKINLVTNRSHVRRVCKVLETETLNFKVLALDSEWVYHDDQRQPVALLQLCSVSGYCALIRLNKLKECPEELRLILENPNIITVGFGIAQDAIYLSRDYNVNLSNTLDIRHLYPTSRGLVTLANDILQLKLGKDKAIQCSDWEKDRLTHQQIQYAALDSYTCIELFKKWTGLSRGSRNWTEVEADVFQYLNHIYKHTKSAGKGVGKTLRALTSYGKIVNKKQYICKKNQLYDNIQMYGPDGTLLSTISRKKADWYLRENLAKAEISEPLAIKLLFPPKKSNPEPSYSKELKNDQCVVCGSVKELLKHSIMPKRFSKKFPVHLKSRYSHDVLALCLKCLVTANAYETKFHEQLLKIAGLEKVQQNQEEGKMALRKGMLAKALLSEHPIPEQRRHEIEDKLKEICNVEILTKDLLNECATRKETVQTNDMTQEMFDFFRKEDETMHSFRVLFREHFVQTMKPQFLPKRWSVDYKND